MASVDLKALKQQHDIVDIVSRRVPVKKRGTEYYGKCPFHDDHEDSLQVNDRKQLFGCFACGTGGDIFDFLMKYEGYSLPDAIKELNGEIISTNATPEQKAAKEKKRRVNWTQIKPEFLPKDFNHYMHGKPSNVWTYRDAHGSVVGYVCRFDMGDGKKEVVPYTFCQSDKGGKEWRWHGFGVPRTLYNLELITKYPEKTIIVVEGEKTADVVAAHIPKAVVTTWIGGAKAIGRTDFQPLFGRKVILWPDNDKPGYEAVIAISELLSDYGTKNFVHNPLDAPKHWDAADKEWQDGEMRKYIFANLHNEPASYTDSTHEDQPQKVSIHDFIEDDGTPFLTTPIPVIDPAPETGEDESTVSPKGHFKILGFVKGEGDSLELAFYSVRFRSILLASASGLTKNFMMQLAPVNYWEDTFPASKTSWDTTAAANWMIEVAGRKGIFNPKYVRGRGAWYDNGHVVVHAGDQLIVDGHPVPLGQFKSKYIYEIGETLNFYTENPLSTKEANALVGILKRLSWSREVDALLLAGWCVVAPICGGMYWRPHIWVTGPAGSGKTWLMSNVVSRMLGDSALRVQNETTEAGIRQTLRYDALPVVFDEAEGENNRAQERMQGVLTLMRSASSEDGGSQIKGSATGGSVSYRIRSCFAFSSIGIVINQQSDRSRITLLTLQENKQQDRREHWEQTQLEYYSTVTDDYVRRFQARTIRLLPVIISNAKMFSKAIDIVLESKRTGDQLGALLAGAYSLHSDKEISLDEAINWVKSKDWEEEKQLKTTKDELRLLDHILQHTTYVETKEGGRLTRSIGELVHISIKDVDPNLRKESADLALRRIGIKTSKGELIFSDNSIGIERILRNTPWTKNYNKILERIPDSHKTGSQRFAQGSTPQRATAIPLTVINEDYAV